MILNTTNFLGYETEKKKIVMIRNIQYTGEMTNEMLNFEYVGLPPSVSKLLSLSNEYLDKGATSGDAKSEDIVEKGTYKHFVSFMVDNEKYLVTLDNEDFKKSVISEGLMNHIIHGR